MSRLAAVVLVLAIAPRAAPDPLAAARAHLKEGKFDLVIDDIADPTKVPHGPGAQVFADAAEMALQKSDRSFASLYCERALSLEPHDPRALRTCTTVAIEDARFADAERWGDDLGAQLPRDAEVALLRAQAARARESWDIVIVLLEPHESDKVLKARIAPLLAEARKSVERPAVAADPAVAEDKVEAVLRTAREAARGEEAHPPDPAAKKKWRPIGEKVVLYVVRNCSECERAREWLQANDVEFEERDADHSGQAYREAIKICGKARQRNCLVPIVVVNGNAVSGLDVVQLKAWLEL